ncbi:unnamed protein product [Lymnaea stagnalis]|uniref:Glutathione transferase n=1 Tax=Lymnaea stagnalis TaxID=6523 RepID=A0AAV2H5Y4_LYMST
MAKLYYFNGRGRGEIVRLTLAAADIQVNTIYISTKTDINFYFISDGKLYFGQLPCLEIDGKHIVQANAIVRYLGKRAGLLGTNEDEALLVDQYYEGSRDFMSPSLAIGFSPEEEVLATIKTKTLPKFLPIFNKIAANNGTGHLVGNSLTLADVSLLEPLLVYVEYFGKEILQDFPALLKLWETTTNIPSISGYLNGPLRKPKNDERYIQEVQRALARN